MKKKLLSALLAASLIASSVMSLGAWAVEPETTFTKGDQTYKVLQVIEDFTDSEGLTVYTKNEATNGDNTVTSTHEGEYKATWSGTPAGFYHHGFVLPETTLDGDGITFELTTSKGVNASAANAYLGLSRTDAHNFTSSTDRDDVWSQKTGGDLVVPATLMVDPNVAADSGLYHYRVMVPYADLGDVDNLMTAENGDLCLQFMHNLYTFNGGGGAITAGDTLAIDNIATYEEVTEEEEEPPAATTKEVTYGDKTYTITVAEDCEDGDVEGNPWKAGDGWLLEPEVATVPDGNKAFGDTQEASASAWGGVSIHLKDLKKVTGEGVYFRVYMDANATLNNPDIQKSYAVVVKDFNAGSDGQKGFTYAIETLPYAIHNDNSLAWKNGIASYWHETEASGNYKVVDVLIPFEDLKTGKDGTTPDPVITDATFENGVEVGIAFGKWAFTSGNVPTSFYIDDVGFYTSKAAEVSSEETSSDESSEEVSSGETSSEETSSETPTSDKKRMIYDTFENWKNDLSLRSGVKHGSESNGWIGNNYDTISLDKETPAVGKQSFKIVASGGGDSAFFRLYHQIDDKVTLKKIAQMLADHHSDPDQGAGYAREHDDTAFTFYAKATGDLADGSWSPVEEGGDPRTEIQLRIGFTTSGAQIAIEGFATVTNEWQKFTIPLSQMGNAPANITTENDTYANWAKWKGVTDPSQGGYPFVVMNSVRVAVMNKTAGTTLYLDNIGFEGSNLTPGFEFDYKYDNLAEEATHFTGALEDIPPVDEELNKYGDTSSDVSSDTSSDTSSETPSFDADAAMDEFYNLEGEKWMVENFESYDSFDALYNDCQNWVDNGMDLNTKSTQPLQDYRATNDGNLYAVTNDLLTGGINSKTYQFKKDDTAGDKLYPRVRVRVNNTMADADGNHLFGDGIAVDVTTTVPFGLKASLLVEPFAGTMEAQSSEKQVTVAENGGKVTVYFPWTDFMSGDGTLEKLNKLISRYIDSEGAESFLIGLIPTITGMANGDTVLMDNIRFYTAAPEGMAADIEALAKTEGDANYNAVRDFLSAAYDSLKAEDGTMTGTETQYAALQELIDELKPDAPKKGDLNGDGEVTIADALQALRYSVGLDNAADLTAEQIAVGDMNADGKITAVDALMILRTAVGLPV